MPIVLEDIAKSYGQQVLFENLNFQLPAQKKCALVGRNGAGKTTLLNMISGLDSPDRGRVVKSRDVVIGYLPQEPNPQPQPTVLAECLAGQTRLEPLRQKKALLMQKLEAASDEAALHEYEEVEAQFQLHGGYHAEAEAQKILRGLGFTAAQIADDPCKLSGGWRMRLELAKIFLDQPDLLILDEPTNHLDLPSLAWVEDWLQRYPHTLVFVSHDRSLLNKLADVTLHLDAQGLQSYPGNFDAFLTAHEQRQEQLAQQAAQIARRRDDLQQFVDRFGAKATKARQAQSRLKMIARLNALEASLDHSPEAQDVAIQLPEPPPCGRQPLEVKGLSIGYPGHPALASDLNLALERGARVAVIGANGIGKSTLLKTLVDQVKPIVGQIEWGYQVSVSYLAQDQYEVIKPELSLLDNVLASCNAIGQLEARKLLGSLLFSGDDVHKKAAVLSGGEKNRLGMACLLASPANVLLLDEPTNHLDMTSAALLTEALCQWHGTLVFVSHDRPFIEALATHVFVMLPDGRSALFTGGLADYRRSAAQSGFPDVLQPAVEKAALDMDKATAVDKTKGAGVHHQRRKQQQKLKAKLQKIESKIQTLQQQIEADEQAMFGIKSDDYLALETAQQAIACSQQEVDRYEQEWLELSEQLEQDV